MIYLIQQIISFSLNVNKHNEPTQKQKKEPNLLIDKEKNPT